MVEFQTRKRPRVFVVQEPLKRNADGELERFMDLTKVAQYGQPIVCLKSGKVTLSPGPTIDRLWEVLKDFSDDDYLVAVGDPSAIAVAAAIAAEVNNGRFKLLKWDKRLSLHIEVDYDIHYARRRKYAEE